MSREGPSCNVHVFLNAQAQSWSLFCFPYWVYASLYFEFVFTEQSLAEAAGMVLPYEISGWGENFWVFSGGTGFPKPRLEPLEFFGRKRYSQSFCMKPSNKSQAAWETKRRKQAPKTSPIHILSVLANKNRTYDCVTGETEAGSDRDHTCNSWKSLECHLRILGVTSG